jgi:hypothetical protein
MVVSVAALFLTVGAGCESSRHTSTTLQAKTRAMAVASATPATGLKSQVDCSQSATREGLAQLGWTPSGSQQQRVELTVRADGFERGDFETSKTLPGGQGSFTWMPLQGQAIHFWRVSTFNGTDWAPSDVSSFVGPTCVAGRAGGQP